MENEEGRKHRILIAEDDIQLVDMYKRKFDIEGFLTEIAEDGEKTLKAIREFKPDLVLLDIMMPKIDGLEVLEILRNNPETKDILVVMLTNLGSETVARKIKNLHATDYIVKADFTPLEVANRVTKILNERAEARLK
ncbi:MAG: two component transcriptional regulator, two-component system, OmpR family, phosphate regulon response regulator PhoB [candidate division CPR2 bacterium GW2011_GWC1_39_9]|uniref:Two component transcriptional regulator, winged helix family n=1 Tax=candidate division CPR2 bacterium GW2011_GWC2_39_10 TaxID=1618345 RepID=A0A0G0LYR9_UNCC2|nr:MAG: Two component transcriptional regulator, winged helix family [candidate division CPR2 bacterium GW2011_GWC2_39_10]KKR33437.1 MAG: two component transcriptional regulator, two-component system, OmpR family, phosphate regulon response regulator PhoB [candidate division CPR2 bacterium GW2011_GWC1_39_9]